MALEPFDVRDPLYQGPFVRRLNQNFEHLREQVASVKRSSRVDEVKVLADKVAALEAEVKRLGEENTGIKLQQGSRGGGKKQ